MSLPLYVYQITITSQKSGQVEENIHRIAATFDNHLQYLQIRMKNLVRIVFININFNDFQISESETIIKNISYIRLAALP